jgi:hypothetical protein
MSSPRLAWYPWFTGDWLAQTRGWCVTARGVARELLDVQWDRGCLPADPEELRTLISASRRDARLLHRLRDHLVVFVIGRDIDEDRIIRARLPPIARNELLALAL